MNIKHKKSTRALTSVMDNKKNCLMSKRSQVTIFIIVGILIISGIALPFYIEWPLDKKMLLIKHVFVVWIIIVGFFLGFSSRKMNRLAPREKEKPSPRFLKVKSQMRLFSIINLILWYLVTLLSVFV